MSEPQGHGAEPPAEGAAGSIGDLLGPTPSALAAFVIVVAGVMGDNVVATGVRVLLGEGTSATASPRAYLIAMGIGTLVPLVLVVWLARRSLAAQPAGWPAQLARASLLLSAVVALGAVLVMAGGAFRG